MKVALKRRALLDVIMLMFMMSLAIKHEIGVKSAM